MTDKEERSNTAPVLPQATVCARPGRAAGLQLHPQAGGLQQGHQVLPGNTVAGQDLKELNFFAFWKDCIYVILDISMCVCNYCVVIQSTVYYYMTEDLRRLRSCFKYIYEFTLISF